MDIVLLILFVIGFVLAIVGLFVPPRLFEIGVLIALGALFFTIYVHI